MEKIDIVITWVDGNDPDWLAEKKKYESHIPHSVEGNAQNRFRNWDTLRYWFRGVEKNMGWVNRIFFVTWGHVPEWLDIHHEKIKVIKHSDFIPAEFLPTFNSEVIEFFFHKIPGLSDHFIYFNDDMFPLRRLSEKDFFRSGLPVDYYLHVPFRPKNKSYHHSLFNNYAILNETYAKGTFKKIGFNKIFNIKYGIKNNIRNMSYLIFFKPVSRLVYKHLPVAYTKADYENAWELFHREILLTSKRRFRDDNGINHLLIRDFRLLRGDFCPAKILGRKLSLDENLNYKQIYADSNTLLICLNDSSENIDFEKSKNKLLSFFEEIFHKRSSYELY